MPTVFITGGNRGIGHELSVQYAAAGWRVHATARSDDGLAAIKRIPGDVHAHLMNVTDRASVRAVAGALQGEAVDILINNAGVMGQRDATIDDLDLDDWTRVMETNVYAPLVVTAAFRDHVAASRRRIVATLSSRLGSIGENEAGGLYVYRSSKAAVNAVIKSLSIDLAEMGLIFVLLHPGWVSTDMGGAAAPVTPEESARGIRAVLDKAGPADNCAFVDYQGVPIAW